ncbi:MAG: 30S ribosomal protein S3 [Nanoarchaeota archaeon]
MIERKFVKQKLKELRIQEYIASELGKTGYSRTEVKRTPLGEKIIVYTTRPGLLVGRKGENIQRLTNTLKRKFKMQDPQIEIGEVTNPYLEVSYVCDRIVSTLERFGSKRFKSIGYKTLQGIMDSGAMGAEIVISGKVPSARARSWRFSEGYLKKSGDISVSKVAHATGYANLKSGIIGVKVKIMLPDTKLPDKITIKNLMEVQKEKPEEKPKETEEKKEIKKKEPAKKTEKKETKKLKETKKNVDNKKE